MLNFPLFAGSIPISFVVCQELFSFDVGHNILTGTIPSNIGLVSHLFFIGMNHNSFSGLMPSSLSLLTFLQTLLVEKNFLSGSEGNIFTLKLASLSVVDVSFNNFKGPLPTTVFLLPNITILGATNNCFSGTLPASICNAKKLRVLSLGGLTSGVNCIRRYFYQLIASIRPNF